MEDLHKLPKAQIRDFAPPQRGHAAQVEVFQVDGIIRRTQVVRELPMPGLPLMGNAGMDPCQRTTSLPTMARATSFPCQGAMGLAQISE